MNDTPSDGTNEPSLDADEALANRVIERISQAIGEAAVECRRILVARTAAAEFMD